ncbi:MAG: EcsC family protein [Egibacteraceae bacterium]
MPLEHMSAYEREAWVEIGRWREQRVAAGRRRGRGGALARRLRAVPGSTTLLEGVLRSVQGMHGLVTDVAVSAPPHRGVRRAYAAQGLPITGLGEIRGFDLAWVDRATPPLGSRYALALAGEGALAGAAAGGGVALTAAGAVGAGVGAAPGAASTVGLLSADIAAVLAGSTRAVAHTAAYHGYDARDPWERAFLLGVLGAAVAGDQAAKLSALAELRRLSAVLALGGASRQLGDDVLVRLLRRLFASLGERLTQRKVAQLVPVAGAVVGGGLNYAYVRDVGECASWLYRERFLIDRHGLAEEVAGPLEPARAVEGIAAGAREDAALDPSPARPARAPALPPGPTGPPATAQVPPPPGGARR